MTTIYDIPGPYTSQAFPAPGLRDIVRNITTHNAEGKGIFLPASNAAYDSPMANGHAINNVVYNTTGFPTDLNDEKDIKYSSSHEVWSILSVLYLFNMKIENKTRTNTDF